MADPTPAPPVVRSPRVLFVVDQLRRPVPGGIGTYAKGLLHGLREVEGASGQTIPDISLYASRSPGRWRTGAADPLADLGWPVVTSRLPSRVMTRAWSHAIGGAPKGFQLTHTASLMAPPRRDERGHLVVTVHDVAWRRNPEATTKRGREWHEGALQRALRSADALLAPSEMVARDLAEAGVPEDLVTVVPLGGDHLPLPNHTRARRFLTRIGIGGPYILTVSTLEPRKNITRLLDAYARIRTQLPFPWPLVIIGPRGWGDLGPLTGGTLPDGVILGGSVGDDVLAGLYAAARVFAYVPLSEGYGLPPAEAMNFGVPIVASTGVPSVIPRPSDGMAEDQRPAIRVDPLDTDAIADALLVAALDEVQRRSLITAGAALALQRTWHRSALGHLELWDSLL